MVHLCATYHACFAWTPDTCGLITHMCRHVAFLASFHNPSVIFEQISVIYALPRLFVGSFTLVLPFFPTGTLERVRHGQAIECHATVLLLYCATAKVALYVCGCVGPCMHPCHLIVCLPSYRPARGLGSPPIRWPA